MPASRPSLKLLLGEAWGECRIRVVSRWAAAVAAASMANCLMARSSRYFCSHLVMSASRARICSSFSRSCSDSRRALSSVDPPWLQLPPVRVPVCLCRARNSMVKGKRWHAGDFVPHGHTKTLTYASLCSIMGSTCSPFYFHPEIQGINKGPHILSLIPVVRSIGAHMTKKAVL